MDCRKARYYLVTSFDGPLDAEVKRQLSYHLKDCRACRHESFYYRELFSAERQLEELQPGADFNERLVAQIRLREAQASWPEHARRPARSRRFSLVLAPGVFAAAAALAFVLLSGNPEREVPDPNPVMVDRSTTVSGQQTGLESPTSGALVGAIPRYAPAMTASSRVVTPQEMFRVRYQDPTDEAVNDPFRVPFEDALRSDFARVLPNYGSQERTNYVLPVLHHGNTQEHIY